MKNSNDSLVTWTETGVTVVSYGISIATEVYYSTWRVRAYLWRQYTNKPANDPDEVEMMTIENIDDFVMIESSSDTDMKEM